LLCPDLVTASSFEIKLRMKWKRFNGIQVSLPSSLIQFAQCPKNRLSEKPITVLPTLHRAVDSGASSHVTGMLDDDRNSKKKEEGLGPDKR
jgi:hypothetical protein